MIYRALGKRALDLFIVICTVWFTIPVIFICAAITALDGHCPFFGHKRVGRRGQEFRCWKIRSMVVDSAALLEELLAADPAARAEWDATQKLKKDPRITRIGRFLRKSSLDELPQIFNILKGEMSIVGPRPVLLVELDRYGEKGRKAYLDMLPGITGMWQVSGRNDVSYEERVALDLQYHAVKSLKQDILIILRTFGVVLMRNGH